MKKLFISQPMRGRSDEEILKERENLIEKAKQKFNDEVEILDSFFSDYNGNALGFLGKSIEVLSHADVAVFGSGWDNARGCVIEHKCSEEYGIEIID